MGIAIFMNTQTRPLRPRITRVILNSSMCYAVYMSILRVSNYPLDTTAINSILYCSKSVPGSWPSRYKLFLYSKQAYSIKINEIKKLKNEMVRNEVGDYLKCEMELI